MPTADKRYRLDLTRSVEIFGPFTDEMASKAIREIYQLRSVSNDPITLLINSDGGSVRVLHIIDGALNTANIDNKIPHVVTVAAGNAFSAGANLLAFGDYAIAYPYSSIHFHGIRLSEYLVTAESAAEVSVNLQDSNDEIARRLSRMFIARLIHRYSVLERGFVRKKKGTEDVHMVDLECFASEVKQYVSPKVARLIDMTLKRVRDARHLTRVVFPKVGFHRIKSTIRQDAKVLQELIKYEIKINKRSTWRLDANGRARLMNDYSLLWDYHLGPHMALLDDIVWRLGPMLLTPREFKKYKKLPTDNKQQKRREYLRNIAGPKFEPFWFFAVKLTRQLLLGENPLSAEDAYWIGAVDEVIGTNLSGIREIQEADIPQSPPVPAASNASSSGTTEQSPPSSPPPTAP